MNRLAIFDCDGTLVDSQHSEQVRSAPHCAAMSGGHGDLLTCVAMERYRAMQVPQQ